MENTEKHTIEVYCENGGWIEANVVDVYAHELMVTYKNGEEDKIPFDKVRLPPDVRPDEQPASLKEGEVVEVSHSPTFGGLEWRLATLKQICGEEATVEYAYDSKYFFFIKIKKKKKVKVPLKNVRPKNTNRDIIATTFYQIEISIPTNLDSTTLTSLKFDRDNHIIFKNMINACVCHYIHETNNFRLISTEAITQKNAEWALKQFITFVEWKCSQRSHEREQEQYPEVLVKIPDNLVDILNRTSIIEPIVRKVKNIRGISHVIKDVGKPSFRIKGSMEAVEKARIFFDISTVCVQVPDRLVQVIKSVYMQGIVDSCKILIAVIKIKGNKVGILEITREIGKIPFIFIGSEECISNAEFCVNAVLKLPNECENVPKPNSLESTSPDGEENGEIRFYCQNDSVNSSLNTSDVSRSDKNYSADGENSTQSESENNEHNSYQTIVPRALGQIAC